MHVYIYIGTADTDAFINDPSIFRVESEDIEKTSSEAWEKYGWASGAL